MLALPFRVDETGSIATTTDLNEQLTHRVFSVLATELGERLMIPTYGWDFNHFLFEPIDALDQKYMLQLASTALGGWEPGATLVGMHFEKTAEAQMKVSIYYSPVGSAGVITSELSFGTADDGRPFTEILTSSLSKPVN